MANTILQIVHMTGTTGTTSNSTQTYTITPNLTNIDRAFAIVMFRHTQAQNHDGTWHAWEITSISELTIWNGSSTISIDFDAYIVEFDTASDIRTQVGTLGDVNGSTAEEKTNSTTPATSTLTALTLAESMEIDHGHQHTGTDTTIGQEEYAKVRLLTSTTWGWELQIMPNTAQPINKVGFMDWNDVNVFCQRGQDTIGTTSTSLTLTAGVDFTTVDPTRSMIIITDFMNESNFSMPIDETCLSATFSGNDIVVTRQAQGGFSVGINWTIVEFPDGFASVEHLTHTMGGGTTSNSDTITALTDFTKAFPMSTCNSGLFGWGNGRPTAADTTLGAVDRTMCTLDLSSNTNVNFDRGDGTGAIEITYQVIEFLPQGGRPHWQGYVPQPLH